MVADLILWRDQKLGTKRASKWSRERSIGRPSIWIENILHFLFKKEMNHEPLWTNNFEKNIV